MWSERETRELLGVSSRMHDLLDEIGEHRLAAWVQDRCNDMERATALDQRSSIALEIEAACAPNAPLPTVVVLDAPGAALEYPHLLAHLRDVAGLVASAVEPTLARR